MAGSRMTSGERQIWAAVFAASWIESANDVRAESRDGLTPEEATRRKVEELGESVIDAASEASMAIEWCREALREAPADESIYGLRQMLAD